MHLLEAAEKRAAERGYLQDPVVSALLPKVPQWFGALGTPAGQVAFERTRGFALPAALREFYGRLPLACFLHAAIDGQIFSAGLFGDEPDPPPVVRWASGLHVAFAYHPHSQSLCAAAVDADDPLAAWGDEDESDRPVGRFSDWVYRTVEGHERVLDQLQALYESPGAARDGEMDWVLRKPGMKARVCGERRG